MRLHVLDNTFLIVVIFYARWIILIINPRFNNIFLHSLVNIWLGCCIGAINNWSILFNFHGHVNFGVILNLNIFTYFHIVWSSMCLSPICQLRWVHVYCMIRIGFFHYCINSWELRSFINVCFKFLRSFNHVFKLEFVVNVIFNITFWDSISAKDTPFGLDSWFWWFKSCSN